MQSQVYAFLIFILNGLLIGLLFDIFRVSRKSFKTSDLVTYLEDILFWFLSGLILIYSIFKFNNGELRLFIFIGVFSGLSLYILIFSKLFINITVQIINIIKKVFNIICIIPIKFIVKIINRFLYKPLKHLLKIFKKYMSLFKRKAKNMLFINIKFKNKKDFA